MEGNAKAEARGTKGRGTLGAPKLVGARQVEGDGVRQVEGDQLLGVRRGETNCLGRNRLKETTMHQKKVARDRNVHDEESFAQKSRRGRFLFGAGRAGQIVCRIRGLAGP